MTSSKAPASSIGRPSVRYRSRTGLRYLDPTLDASALFPLAEARHDRIKGKIAARVYANENDIGHIMGHWEDRDGIGSGLLRQSQAQQLNRWRLYTPGGRWLFGLSGFATWVPAAGRFDFDLDVDLNPTRFMAHQADPSLNTIRQLDPLDALRIDPEQRTSLCDQTLDGNDNVLIGRGRLSDFAVRGAWWRQVVEVYLDHVRDALSAAFAPEGTSASIDRFCIVSPRVVEVHWELDHVGAIHWVKELQKAIREADAAAVGTTFVKDEGICNAAMLTVKLTANINLKIYAKMFGRVRLEIEYENAGRIKQAASMRGRYTNQSFVDILLGLRRDAAGRLQDFWSGAMDLGRANESAVSLKQFIVSLVRAAHGDNAEAVLDALIANRRLEQTATGSFAPPTVCEALVREGVVVRARLRKRATPQYALTAPYVRMLDIELRGSASSN